MNKKLTIFVDTAAFVAFIKEDDTTHEKAKHLFQQLQSKTVTFFTSNYGIISIFQGSIGGMAGEWAGVESPGWPKRLVMWQIH